MNKYWSQSIVVSFIELIEKHTYVKLVKRFINDDCAFWDPAAEISDKESAIKFDKFKSAINNNKGLTWEFTEIYLILHFLDLTLSSCLIDRNPWHSTFTSHHTQYIPQEL